MGGNTSQNARRRGKARAVRSRDGRRLAEVPTESVRVSLIRWSMLSYIQTTLALSAISTVKKLSELGRSVGEVHLRASSYCRLLE